MIYNPKGATEEFVTLRLKSGHFEMNFHRL
jgi:hypothetical protein